MAAVPARASTLAHARRRARRRERRRALRRVRQQGPPPAARRRRRQSGQPAAGQRRPRARARAQSEPRRRAGRQGRSLSSAALGARRQPDASPRAASPRRSPSIPDAVSARIELAATYRDMGQPERGLPLLAEGRRDRRAAGQAAPAARSARRCMRELLALSASEPARGGATRSTYACTLSGSQGRSHSSWIVTWWTSKRSRQQLAHLLEDRLAVGVGVDHRVRGERVAAGGERPDVQVVDAARAGHALHRARAGGRGRCAAAPPPSARRATRAPGPRR